MQTLRKNERASGVDFKEVFGKDHADSFLLLESGRADAFVMDGQILAGHIVKAKNPADFKIVGEVLSVEPIAIMMRKDDPAFKKAVDDSIKAMMQVRRARQAVRQVVHAADPADATPRSACRVSDVDQGCVGQPERQADGRLREEVMRLRRCRCPSAARPVRDWLVWPAARRARLQRRALYPDQLDDRHSGCGHGEAGLNGTWDWQVFALRGHRQRRRSTYLDWMMSAWGWTLSVAALALVVALVVGSLIGILRTTPNRLFVAIGNAWTELFRNVPLLVQVFLWYHVLPSLFPALRAMPSFVLVVFALGFFTSARDLRAGQGRHPGAAARPALRRPGDGPDAAADLPLRAAADGVSHRHPAADQRVR